MLFMYCVQEFIIVYHQANLPSQHTNSIHITYLTIFLCTISLQDFGETPQYLLKRREEIRRAQEEYDAYIAEHFRRGTMKQLTREEREHILAGLKANWEEIHKEYQGLSVVTDTAPKKNRKERMEAEMKQLERDIQVIEKHTQIYIGN